jgi:cell division protein FtsQ
MSNAAALREVAEGRGARPTLRWARPVLVAVIVLCGLVLLARFVAEPLMTIRHVVVHSDVQLADDQVLALSGLQGGEHWYSLSAASVVKRLEASPLVRNAAVELAFPDTVRLTVWGRQAAAVVLATASGRSLPVLVDGEGTVFKIGATGTDVDLPVVSGLAAGNVALGAQLPAPYRQLFADLRSLRENSPSLYGQVSEVRIVSPGSDPARGFDLLVYLTSSTVPVRAPGTIDGSLLKYALMVMDLLSQQGIAGDIQELDFRGGDAVYKVRGVPTPGDRSTDAGNARSTDAGREG